MGGVGKTELALQYARRYGDAFAGGVCWLRGVEPIGAQIVGFARDYLGPGGAGADGGAGGLVPATVAGGGGSAGSGADGGGRCAGLWGAEGAAAE